ncbi:MAG TPA: 3-oxoacyl-[acyl-carrier-protein] synthase III C-terminal domain-containing protein, partial [Clostridia bacterium]|nr:3-oxoacyl-[acyl-carrier-protein] synthase III C-terminal domain-containing protein [Clostridia bacterium]
MSSRSQALIRKVLMSDNGIEARHLCLDSLDEAFGLDADWLNKRFALHAPRLGAQAAERALRDSGTDVLEVDALLVSTCTGYLCPGLTSYLSERLGLKTDTLLLDLVGQGCGAAVPNLRTAEALLASGRARRVLSVCVEICSAAFYLDEDPGVVISACLFGDGAGAAVLSAEPGPGMRQVRWRTAETLLSPADRDYLRFELRDGKLRNILSRQVPELGGKYAARIFQQVLAREGLERDQISTWILHAGGKNILTALQDRMGLSEANLQWTAAVLREYGNLSSACVLFVLNEALSQGAPGGWWWMCSFGAGFACH